MASELSDEDRLDWLQLIRSQGIGPMSFARLMARFGSAAEALDALPELGRKNISPASRQLAEKEYSATYRFGARFIALPEPDYPPQLREITDPPPLIAVRGPLPLAKPSVAIVGARNASAIGRRIAATLAQELGEAGYTVVSGLARGIDGAAHLSAMRTGTVAVIAGGINQVYPPEHTGLYSAITDNGAVVTEVPYDHVARAQDFPKRNRIVSGLSLGVIVVEAAERSGTLITARLAAEQGRDVFAVPGSPLDPRSSGTNRLIRQGATLIRHTEDVLEGLQTQGRLFEPDTPYGTEEPTEMDDPDALRQLVLSLLGVTPIHQDELVRETSAPASHVADILLDLVLDGQVEESAGGRFALATDSLSSI